MHYKYYFKYTLDGRTVKIANKPNDDFSFELDEHLNTLKLKVLPKSPLQILEFYLQLDYKFHDDSRFFANGFQSWTDTKEFTRNETVSDLNTIGKSPYGKMYGMKYVGDYTFIHTDYKKGQFHSHGFAYVRNGDNIDLFGSLDDRTGYTLIYADMHNDSMRFSKDLDGKTIDEPYEVLNLFITGGDYDEVFDEYFKEMGVKPRTNNKIKGYTSWYNYYQDISEDIILRDLNSLAQQKEYVNTYQVDDGYETKVGDWLLVDKKKFPHGMKPIADAIHENGFKAGIWLAPFGAQKGSVIAKEHPDWLITDESGKPVPVGHNWGGFYALDIYNEEARQYIKDVFHEVLDVWGFDLVKLDFLYAASVLPIHGKTRGEIAYDSIDLLRECVGDKEILGCGVQQMPCFGKVEYMRIGPDMALWWPHKLLRKNMHREDVSTPNAVHNSIYRRCLNGRAFLCDPDVFLLRRDNIEFTFEQQKTLAKFIKLFGGVLFMSDDISQYNEEQLEVFRDVLSDDDSKVTHVSEENGKVYIEYTQHGKTNTLKFDIENGEIL
ncbi:MAG: alpha-galactosidase [Eubacterium sp.]|nr:alpha-galactosidase [Eubacterium sp.]